MTVVGTEWPFRLRRHLETLEVREWRRVEGKKDSLGEGAGEKQQKSNGEGG